MTHPKVFVMNPVALALSLFFLCGAPVSAQVLQTRPAPAIPSAPDSSPAPAGPSVIPAPLSVALTVPVGMSLKVVLDEEVRIQKVGQPIHGKVVEPVYAFDKLVIPAGSQVSGKISGIAQPSRIKRTLAAMDGNFSPERQVQLQFDDLRLADGRRIPLSTVVSPGSQGVLQFVPASGSTSQGTVQAGKNLASRKISDARQELKREWEMARSQVREPGKIHRMERYAVAQLPYHPQYIDAGTAFNAGLRQPLDFGSESVSSEAVAAIGTPPPTGSIVHALLVTPLSSATTKKDDLVEAILTQPLFASGRLLLPQGSRLKGSVLQVRPARRWSRNGQLRIVFHEVAPPNGLEQKTQASLEGVEVARSDHLTLDSEGGAQVTTPRTRYLRTALAVALATASFSDDREIREHGDAAGGAANGASGFHLVGTIAGALAHSRVITSGFGVYGATMSVYSHFVARGRDVIYPRDMMMVVSLGARDDHPPAPPATTIPGVHN